MLMPRFGQPSPARSVRRRNVRASCRRCRGCPRSCVERRRARGRDAVDRGIVQHDIGRHAALARDLANATPAERRAEFGSPASSAPPDAGAISPRLDLVRLARMREPAVSSRSITSVSPFRTPRAVSVSFNAPKASLSGRRWPIATNWRSAARHCFSLSSRPMPNTDNLSCPNCLTRSVRRPTRTSIRCIAPKRCPVR